MMNIMNNKQNICSIEGQAQGNKDHTKIQAAISLISTQSSA